MQTSKTCSLKPLKSSPSWFGLILNAFIQELNYQNQDLWQYLFQLPLFDSPPIFHLESYMSTHIYKYKHSFMYG